MGMQSSFTKNCCISCLSESNAVSKVLKQKDLVSSGTFMPGDNIIKVNYLVDIKKVLPLFHSKLGQIKKYRKGLGQI